MGPFDVVSVDAERSPDSICVLNATDGTIPARADVFYTLLNAAVVPRVFPKPSSPEQSGTPLQGHSESLRYEQDLLDSNP